MCGSSGLFSSQAEKYHDLNSDYSSYNAEAVCPAAAKFAFIASRVHPGMNNDSAYLTRVVISTAVL